MRRGTIEFQKAKYFWHSFAIYHHSSLAFWPEKNSFIYEKRNGKHKKGLESFI